MEEEECLYLMISKPIILITFLFLATAIGQDSIIFPHNYHIEDEELECNVCHADVEMSSSLQGSLLPLMEVCGDCHDVDEDCEMCHESPDDADTYPVSGSTSGTDFSHLFHLQSFSDCSRCHTQTIEDDGLTPRPEWQSWNCSACHQENKPQDHDITWKEFHGMSLQDLKILVAPHAIQKSFVNPVIHNLNLNPKHMIQITCSLMGLKPALKC